MNECYLTLDLGTGSSRAALVSVEGELLGMKSFANSYRRDEHYEDAQYFLPAEWRTELLRCCRELCAQAPSARVTAVTSAGARQSIVLLDRTGNAFYGLPNIDNRGRAYMDRVGGRDEIYRLSGRWATEDFDAAKLMGFREVYPEQYARIDKITSISEWMAQIFTGRVVIEPSQACETQLYDIGERKWSDALCARYGLDRCILPELCPCGMAVGPILPEFREMLHAAETAVFVIGGADTQIALRQVGMQVGDIAVVSGTTSPVVTRMEEKFYDPRQRVWTDADLGGGTYQIEMNPGVTGLNYQRAKELLCPDLSYGELESAYAAKTSFTCTASFSSLLFDRQRSLRRGGFFLPSPLDGALDRTDLLWAVVGDIACSIYEQFSNLCTLTGNRSPWLLGCGGGLQSPALRQMLADLSGREVRLRPGFEQATVLGLAAVCAEALGAPGVEPGRAEDVVCRPGDGGLIRRYYPVWLENRNRANQVSETQIKH
jgi:Sugar (pentulose and hexulose) kinases